jgi:adenylosuccinate synthase
MRHAVVVDLGFGDAGKGTVVDWLCGPAAGPAGFGGAPAAVVRFNGGAQAAHNVVTPGGRHHTFAQFGSGTLHGVPTLLSRHMLVEPLALAAEAAALAGLGVADPFGLLRVDAEALLTTPYHGAVNRARELVRGTATHGSCGIGVGETAAYALTHPAHAPRAGDCADPRRLRARLRALRDWALGTVNDLTGSHVPLPPVDDVADAYAAFAGRVELVGPDALRDLAGRGRLVFEGAQGVLLDEHHGFHPHTTRSTTTSANALGLLADAGVDVADAEAVLRVGVTRTYATRHGSGPFVTEDPALRAWLPEWHNDTGRWQGAFRVGHLDLVGLRYAADACGGLDALAITHVDIAETLARVRPGALRVGVAWDVPGGRGRETLHRLPTGPLTPEERERSLTPLAFAARPVLGPGPTDWGAMLEQELRVPVLVESHGPTWRDKRPAAARRVAA